MQGCGFGYRDAKMQIELLGALFGDARVFETRNQYGSVLPLFDKPDLAALAYEALAGATVQEKAA
jgi:hypothetical protein